MNTRVVRLFLLALTFASAFAASAHAQYSTTVTIHPDSNGTWPLDLPVGIIGTWNLVSPGYTIVESEFTGTPSSIWSGGHTTYHATPQIETSPPALEAAIDGTLAPLGGGPGPGNDVPPLLAFDANLKANKQGVERIEYEDPDDGWQAVGGELFPLVVYKGTAVKFRAVKLVPEAAWPNGKPVWGGTSGAAGASETKTVTFNALSADLTDTKTITAECGNTVTGHILVYELAGVLTPFDDFEGRNQDMYGVMEEVDLGLTTNPEGVDASDAGGLKWAATFGGVSVQSGDGRGTYTAPGRAYPPAPLTASDTLTVEIQSGPSKGKKLSYVKKVCENP